MKILGISALFIASMFGKDETIETLQVRGNCGMCKARIEKALNINGVKQADWDVKSKTLTVRYEPQTIKLTQIEGAVTAAGHDTEKVKAPDTTYVKLPGCCQYDR